MLAYMHPLGLADDWADKLKGQVFVGDNTGVTFEHYMQVCAVCGVVRCAVRCGVVRCRGLAGGRRAVLCCVVLR